MHKIYQPSHSSRLVDAIDKFGYIRDSERGKTVEVLGAKLTVRNPRNRIDVTRARRMNPAFAFAEFLAMLYGEDDVKYFQQFIPSYDQYSTDGKVLDGAYGPRLEDQIVAAIDLLEKQPNSRRAVMTIYRAGDLLHKEGGSNTPCTVSLQAIQGHEGTLDMIAYMRSSDIHLGLPNDVAAFTLLQELIATRLGWELGEYIHLAGSLHYYTNSPIKTIAGMAREEGRWPYFMYPMSKDFLNVVYNTYEVFRALSEFENLKPIHNLKERFALDMAFVGLAIVQRKSNTELAREAYNNIYDPTLRRVTFPWLPRG